MLNEMPRIPYPMSHVQLQPPEYKFENGLLSVQSKIYAECMELHETAIFDAVCRAAREAGVNELFLLDRQFVLNALTSAIAEYKKKEACSE